MSDINALINRAEQLLIRLEGILPHRERAVDWSHQAYRWRAIDAMRHLQPVLHPHRVAMEDLLCVSTQKQALVCNTERFVSGKAANNALLWGSRGTGKSTLIKAVFQQFVDRGLRLIEVDKEHLVELPDVIEPLFGRPERFVIYCDDLSFTAEETGYKALKAVLEGSIVAPPENVLVYATSNRRHLMPELQSDNRLIAFESDELHLGEAVEEKVSLSERFGLWLSFYPFDQEQYLMICDHWLNALSCSTTEHADVRAAALQWARLRGSRSGRVARQFALDRVGRS